MAILISIQPQHSENILTGKKTGELRKTKPTCKLPCKVYIYESKGREFPFSVKIDTITRDNNSRFLDCKRGMPDIRERRSKKGSMVPFIAYGKMKVVAEFTLKSIDEFRCCAVPYHKQDNLGYENFIDDGVYQLKGDDGYVFERPDKYIDSMLKNKDLEALCLTPKQVYDYVKGLGGVGYIWHIDDLIVYDKPKDIREFKKPCISPECPYCPSCPVGTECISEEEQEAYRAFGECSTEWVCLDWLKKPPQSWCYVEEL